MTATAKAIAARCGVSLPTVWQILGGRAGRYGAATREAVLAAARELGYRPAGGAKAIATGRTDAVALVLSTAGYRSHLSADLLAGIHDALAEGDQHLVVVRLDDERMRDPALAPKLLRQHLVDGLLLNYTMHVPGPFEAAVERHRIPAIWINHRRPHDAVVPDDAGAGRAATQALLARGHRRIVFLSAHSTPHGSILERGDGYAAAMAAAGLPARRLTTDGGPEVFQRAARALLRGADRPTAAVCYRPVAAYGLHAAALALGLRVPRDLSLVTFDVAPGADTGIPLATWPIPDHAQGRAAVEALRARIAGGGPQPTRAIPYGPGAGDTLAPPPEHA